MSGPEPGLLHQAIQPLLYTLCNCEFSLMILFFWLWLKWENGCIIIEMFNTVWVREPFSSSQGLKEIIQGYVQIKSYLEFFFPEVMPPNPLHLLGEGSFSNWTHATECPCVGNCPKTISSFRVRDRLFSFVWPQALQRHDQRTIYAKPSVALSCVPDLEVYITFV